MSAIVAFPPGLQLTCETPSALAGKYPVTVAVGTEQSTLYGYTYVSFLTPGESVHAARCMRACIVACGPAQRRSWLRALRSSLACMHATDLPMSSPT